MTTAPQDLFAVIARLRRELIAAQELVYSRVSTDEQGRSGLGLEAQAAAIRAYAASVGGKIVGEHMDVQSGADDSRPGLEAAKGDCRRFQAKLLVAKLDRLSRDASFILELRKRYQVVAADAPHDDALVTLIKAGIAEEERKKISQRTRDALAAVNHRIAEEGSYVTRHGKVITRLGSVAGAAHLHQTGAVERGRHRSGEVSRDAAEARAADLRKTVNQVMAAGAASLREIAAALNARGLPATRGGQWSPSSVRLLLARLDAAP